MAAQALALSQMHVNALVATKHTKKDIPGTLLREVPENMHGYQQENKLCTGGAVVLEMFLLTWIHDRSSANSFTRSLNKCEKCKESNELSYSVNTLAKANWSGLSLKDESI